MANDSLVVSLLNELFSTTDATRRAALKAVIAVVGSGDIPRAEWQARALATADAGSEVQEEVRQICRRLGVPE